MPKTLDSNVLFRTVSFDRSSLNDTERTIEFSLSSEAPCERWFGTEILSHQPDAIRLERLRTAGPLLFGHDTTKHIGRVIDVQIRDAKLYVKAKFSRSPLGEEKWRDVTDGILRESSVGYLVHKFEVDEDTETYTAIDWEPVEATLCACPADLTTGIGRANDETFTAELISTRSMETNTADTTTDNPHRMTDTQLLEHGKKIREFVGAIRNPSWKEKAEFIAEKAVLEGLTFREFRERALPNFTTEICLDVPFAESRQGRAINSGSGTHRSIGEIVTTSPEFRAMLKSGFSKNSPGINIYIPKMDRFRTDGHRALTTSGLTSVQREPGVVEDALTRVTVLDLLDSGTTDKKSIVYARETLWTSGAGMVGEGVKKPESTLTVAEVTAVARKVAHSIKASKEQLDDFPEVRSLIDTRMPQGVAIKEEQNVLFGTGIGDELQGILSTPGIISRVVVNTDDTTTVGSFYKALTDIRTSSPSGAGYEPDGWVINPRDWERLTLMKDAVGHFFGKGPFTTGTNTYGAPIPSVDMLWGKPVVVTPAMTQGKALCGAFRIGGKVVHREGINVTIGNENDDFTRNLVTIIAESRLLLLVYLPACFVELTGLPTP